MWLHVTTGLAILTLSLDTLLGLSPLWILYPSNKNTCSLGLGGTLEGGTVSLPHSLK